MNPEPRHSLGTMTVIIGLLGMLTGAESTYAKSMVKIPNATKPPKTNSALSVQPVSIETDKSPWNFWYTVKVENTIPYSYYNEKIELKEGRFHYQIHIWKKEEGFINEENLGAFAKQDENLTPLFYNYKLTYKTSDLTIDGTMDENRLLSIKARRSGVEIPSAKKIVPSRAFFSYMFPAWMGQKLKSLKKNQPIPFQALIEDKIDEGFPVESGRLLLEEPDEIAIKTKTKRLRVTFGDRDALWWVRDNGVAIAIHLPVQKILVQLTTKEKAESFLK